MNNPLHRFESRDRGHRSYLLPWFTDDPLFSFEALNKAFAHYIAPIAIPFCKEKTAYDGVPAEESSIAEFSNHDYDHSQFLDGSFQPYRQRTFLDPLNPSMIFGLIFIRLF